MAKVEFQIESNAKELINALMKISEQARNISESIGDIGDKTSESFSKATDTSEKFGKSLETSQKKAQSETKKTTSLTNKLSGSFNNLLGTVGGRFGPQLQSAFASAQKALSSFSGGFKVLKVAIASTGIGLLVIAFVSLIAFFKKSQSGIETFRVVLSQVGAVVDVIVDRLTNLGGAITDIFSGNFSSGIDKLKNSFTGLGEEIAKETKLVADFERQLISLEKAENSFVLDRSKNNRLIAEGRLIAEDDSKPIQARIDGLLKAQEAEDENLKKEQEFLRKRIALKLSAGEEEIETQNRINEILAKGGDELKIDEIGLSTSTEEDRKELLEDLARLNDLETSSLKATKRVFAERQALEKENTSKLEALRKKAIDAKKKESDAIEKENQRIAKLERDLQKELQSLISKANDIELEKLEGEEKFKKITENSLMEIDNIKQTIIEKGKLIDAEFQLNDEQLKQLQILRDNARTKELEAITKFRIDEANIQVGEIADQGESLDIKESQAIGVVEDLDPSEFDLSEVDFELTKQQMILDVQSSFALKRIELLEQEIAIKEKLAQEDGSVSVAEQNEIDKLNIQKESLDDFVKDSVAKQQELQDKKDEFSMAEFLGVSDEELDNIKEGLNQVLNASFDAINQVLEAEAEAAQIKIEALEERETSLRDELETELALNEAGFASNVSGKKKELDNITKEKAKAQKDAESIQKKQFILDSISQVQNLISAATGILNGFSSIPIVGLPLGIAAVAGMFAFFASAKIKAFNSIGKAEKGAIGQGSTGTITGKRHYQGGERFTDHLEVEKGERWGIISRQATKKHGKAFHDFTNGLNNGKTPDEIMHEMLHGTGVYINPNIESKISNRSIIIREKQAILVQSSNDDKMLFSMNKMSKDIEELKEHQINKTQVIETSFGRIEIDPKTKTRRKIIVRKDGI